MEPPPGSHRSRVEPGTTDRHTPGCAIQRPLFSYSGRTPDLGRAMRAMPPLLRSYLAMGGWVSDHAVVDRDLGTMHVFTGVEIAKVPPSRARLLRAVAG